MKTFIDKFYIKSSTLIIAIFVSLTSMAQDSIPNYSFEYWYSPTIAHNWETTNIFLPPGTAPCTRDTNAYNGNYAMKLKTIKMEDILIPGVATLGNVEINSVSGGVPFTNRPNSLSGFLMHPGQDSVFIAIQFFKNGQMIGGGSWGTTDTIPSYAPFSVPIEFFSNENPDTMNIVFLTDPNKQGSTMIIDGLQLETQTRMATNKEIKKLRIYPNPAINEINIDPQTTSTYNYYVYDISGVSMKEGNNIRGNKKVNLSILNPGTYIIVIKGDNKVLGREVFIKSE